MNKKYPYIGISEFDCILLITEPDYGYCIDGGTESNGEKLNIDYVGGWYGDWIENHFKNITREYLANTYGKVESKEHADFIVELANSNDINAPYKCGNEDLFCFHTDSNGVLYLGFYSESVARDGGEKLITIPMPPSKSEEESKVNLSGVGVSSEQAVSGLKKLGAALSGGDEWPQVGDEVLAPLNGNHVRATICWTRVNNAGLQVALVFDSNYSSFWCALEDLKKPKTPEEELRDELKEVIHAAMANSFGFLNGADNKLVDYMLDKYNITKKP